MKRKKINVFILIYFVFIQFVSPLQVVFAIEKAQNDNITFDIEEKKIENNEALFDVATDPSVDYDELELELPTQATYDLGSIENQYEEATNKVIIQKEAISVNKFSIKLDNLSDGNHMMTLNVLKDGILVDKKTHHFNIKTNHQLALGRTSDEYPKPDDEMVAKDSENTVTSPSLQRDISIEAVRDSTETGTAAIYKLVLKVTGSQVFYKNVKLSIKLPKNDYTDFTQPLDDLIIAGVYPVYNKETKIIDYHFDKLYSGQTYEKIITVDTENGYIPNGTIIKTEANLTFESNEEKLNQKSNAEVTLVASSGISVSKVMDKSQLDDKNSVPTPGGSLRWSISASVSHKKTGQMYLKPGSEIIVRDILPKGLTYDATKLEPGTGKAEIGPKGELIWRFIVPSIEEQKQNEDYLFDKTIEFWTKVSNDSKLIDTTLMNKANISGTSIDNKLVDPASETDYSVTIVDSTGNSINPDGGVMVPIHLGPSDGDGGRGTISKRNPNPTVYQDAYLQFAYRVAGYKPALRHPMENLIYTYNVDKNLILEKLSPPNPLWRQASTTDEYRNDKININSSVNYYYRLNFINNEGKEDSKIFDKFEEGKTYNIEDMGLVKGNRVTSIDQVFKSPVPTKIANETNTQLFFTVKKGFVGQVKNTLEITGRSSYNPANGGYSKGKTQYDFDFNKQFPELYEKGSDFIGVRTANIVARPPQPAPITEIGVQLLEHDKGIVEVGDNRLKVTVRNVKSSQSSMTGPIESVVILPPGLKISEHQDPVLRDASGVTTNGQFQILDDNYNDSGRQRIKFTWNEDYLRKNSNLTAEVNVNILKTAPSSLYMDVYGFSKDKEIQVPSSTENSLTTTILQPEDKDDLNEDKVIKHPRTKSSNVYNLLNTYDLKAEKFVKGPDEDWSKFAKTTPGGTIDYKLSMTNSTGRDISNMTLIDVLPAGGDLGITDNISRDSRFMPYLMGPITLPAEWEGKVSVYYSKEKTPKRDDLIRNTVYPNGTAKLGNPTGAKDPAWMKQENVTDWTAIRSFKVELLPGVTWIKGVDMDITYTMEAPKVERPSDKSIFNPKIDPMERAAWNSFAVATDQGQPIEPHRVGVYINKDIGHLLIKKMDNETKKVLSGAEFEIKNEDGTFIQKIVSNDEGIAELQDIPLGKYTIQETKAPHGYNLSNDKTVFEVTNEKYEHNVTITNKRVKGKLTLTKIDSITGKKLSGAVFEVKNKQGDVIKELITDDNGLADISDLEDGEYILTEVKAPDGYNLLQKSIEFEITPDKFDIKLTVKNTAVGWELPETGGSGILLSTLIGLMFMSIGLSLFRIKKSY